MKSNKLTKISKTLKVMSLIKTIKFLFIAKRPPISTCKRSNHKINSTKMATIREVIIMVPATPDPLLVDLSLPIAKMKIVFLNFQSELTEMNITRRKQFTAP